MAVSHEVGEFRKVVLELEAEFLEYHNGNKVFSMDNTANDPVSENLSLPPWMCQPYIRLEPKEHERIMAEKVHIAKDPSRIHPEFFDDLGNKISRKLSKKFRRIVRRPNYVPGSLNHKRDIKLCKNTGECLNPAVRGCWAFLFIS